LARTWSNDSGIPINADNLNGMETDIVSAKNTATSALSTASGAVAVNVTQNADIIDAKGTATTAMGLANSAISKNTTQDATLANYGLRVGALETLGGLAPGSVTDATIASIIANAASATNAALAAGYVPWIAGHIGIQKSNPQNAFIYIGSGTGTLTDKPVMGIKVKIDSIPGTSAPDGIQSDVNIINGSTDGSVRAILGRVDVNDTSANTGDTVAIWGDAWVTSASNRPTWGGNIYGSIKAGVAYSATMMGLEVGYENSGTINNAGGGIHIVGKGTGAKAAFGLKVSSDPAAGSGQTYRTNLMMGSETGPAENYVWIGSVASGNNPSGVPIFQIDATGKVGIGAAPISSQTLTVNDMLISGGNGLRLGSATGPRIRTGTNSPEGSITTTKGDIFIRTGGADGSASIYVKSTAAGNTGWVGLG